MSKDTLHIREIQISRVLGIRPGEGFALTDISPGINLVFGPNGSGKSTTCKVVQELLWPGHLERPTFGGVIIDGGDQWRIDVDAGHAQCHRNGQTGALPEFGSVENRARYLLGLKELIIDDNADFAKAIADASQGGYDLENAADELGFRVRPKSRKSECDTVQEREGEVEKARQRQLQIEREADRLSDLRERLSEALAAERELELLKKALEYHQADSRCRDLALELKAFPEGVGRLQGDELKQLDSLAEEEKSLLDQRAAEEERHRLAQKELEALALPDDGVPDERLRELRILKESLREIEARIDQERHRREEAAARADEALRLLGEHFTAEQLAGVGSIEQSNLGEFARRVHRLRAGQEVLEERRIWLAKEEPDDARTLGREELHEGIYALTRWLASPSGSASKRRPAWLSPLAMLVLAVTAVGLAAASLWLWVILVGAVIVLLALGSWLERAEDGESRAKPREVHQSSYTSLGLPRPDSWNDETVLALLRDLVRLSGTKALFEERRTRLNQLAGDESVLQRSQEEIENERRELQERLGIALEIGDEWLPILVDRIREWQKATLQVAAAEAALSAPERERERLIRDINELLSGFGYEPIGLAAGADEVISDLERRRTRHESAREAFDRAGERIDTTILPGLAAVASKRSQIFRRLDIDEGQEADLDEWIGRYGEYCELKNKLAKEEAIRDDRAATLADRVDLLGLDEPQVEQHIRDCQAVAEGRDELNQTIGEINRQIKDAKAGHALSDALEQRDCALLALAEARDENGRAVAGAMLTEWVRREAVERSRPQVFQRANDLFIRFTRGTLRLEMDDRATPPAFVARRGSYPFQSLNQLSDGERIQLMMAVRLAFLEQDETKRLPLLVDEVLGTSDDGRSGVLIDTMINIARQGRQVFYCTAQQDEVGKWIARLNEAEVPFKLLDMSELRGGADYAAVPIEIASFETADPLVPDGMSYEEYGRALGVPRLNPSDETIDGVHLWHVLDDCELLFKLLSEQISSWGQLRTLITHGGAGLIDAGNGTFDRARAAAKTVQAACEAWRIGRGKTVDRGVLLDSQCVSDRFIDEVAGLARRVNGDAAAVLSELEDGAVRLWRSDSTERLRVFFEEEGYLSFQMPLTREDLRVRVMAAVAEELHSGVIEHAVVDRILARTLLEKDGVAASV